MKIIDERNVRTIHRKLKKQQYDELMTLSVGEENWVRLLDEGMVTYGDGSPWFYLAKGTLRKFYESLSDEYVGSINIGHTDLATFPERIVGSWTKNDLRLVSHEDGRESLDVRLNLIENHPLVKALKMLPFDLGVSAEFYTTVNEELTNNKDLNPYGVEVVTGVNITDFGIVGDAGNVNSMGVRLKGRAMNVDFKALADALDNEGKANPLEKLNEALSEVLEETVEESVEEEVTEEATEEATEEVEETTEVEKEVAEETEEVSEEASEGSEVTQLSEQLANRLEEMQKEIDSLKAKLAAKEKAEAEFVNKFKNLSVSLAEKKPVVTKEVRQYTDGIGE